jgi:S-adenosylmethionine synthetase
MFGYACNETGELMPAPIHYSHKILRLMAEDRKSGKLKNIEPDSKSQVTFEYVDGRPTKVKSVVISTQHSADVDQAKVRELLRPYLLKSIPENFLKDFNEEEFYVNPTGNFVIGGPDGDTGLTGRKIVVDTYGGYAPHGGGAFSGKDCTKVDRSAAYMARYLAKNIVGFGKAENCTVQLSYAIGVKEPTSVYVYADGKVRTDLSKVLKQHVDLTPLGIINKFDLFNLDLTKTTNYGHFGKEDMPWEVLDLF